MLIVTKDKKPLFASVSIFCAVAALPIARVFSSLFAPKEDLLGYGGLGVALIVLFITLLVGIATGLISIFRGEYPRTLPVIASFINGTALVWIMTKIPG